MSKRSIHWLYKGVSFRTLDIFWNNGGKGYLLGKKAGLHIFRDPGHSLEYLCKVDVTLGKEGGRYVWASPHSSSGGRGAEKGRQFCFFLWGFLDKKGKTMLGFGLEKTKKIEKLEKILDWTKQMFWFGQCETFLGTKMLSRPHSIRLAGLHLGNNGKLT